MNSIMKKKYLLLIIIAVVLAVSIFLIIFFTRDDKTEYNYTVKVSLVDDRSPDRLLSVYENDKKIEFKEIKYVKEDIRLCTYKNPVVFFGDLEGETELRVILTNDKAVVAKIEE